MARSGRSRIAFRVVGLLAVVAAFQACATPSASRLRVTPPGGPLVDGVPVRTSLTLALPAGWRAERRLLAIAVGAKARLTVDGPGQQAPFKADVDLGGELGQVTIAGVPAGANRIVSLEALDDAGTPLPGAAWRAVGTLTAGSARLVLSDATTVAGEVALALLASDRTEKTDVLGGLDAAALTAALVGYGRELKLAHLSLLDAAAIAGAIRTGGGKPPSAAAAAFAQAPGELVVRPTNWPPSLEATLRVSDPASRPVTLRDERALTVGPVRPGSWSLVVTPSQPGLAPLVLPVEVGAGKRTELALTWPTSVQGPALAKALEAGTTGVVKIGGVDTLVSVGGVDYSEDNGVLYHPGLELYTAAGGWKSGPELSERVDGAAAAVFGGKLYWFGGQTPFGLVDSGGVFDPAAGTIGSTTRAAAGAGVFLASAAAFEDEILITGGLTYEVYDQSSPSAFPTGGPTPSPAATLGAPAALRSGSPTPPSIDPSAEPSGLPTDSGRTLIPVVFDAVYGYSPADDSWRYFAAPSLRSARVGMAGGVIDGRWYLCGGGELGSVYINGSTSRALVPSGEVSVLVRGALEQWEKRARMPTPRIGAGAVVVGGKLWVIGGAAARGVPSRAVEVYDPATDTWSIRAPLREARALPAVGLIGGKIVVAGGLAGLPNIVSFSGQADARPIASTEELTP